MGVIYSITNIVNNKRYIGQTVNNNLDRRKIEHLSVLRRGVHHNDYLQRSWNKYGEECFIFEMLEEIDNGQLNDAEKKWISVFNSTNNDCGYNMNPGGNDSSSKEQYRKVMIFHKSTGLLSGIFNTAKECGNKLGVHPSTIYGSMTVSTRTAADYYVRDYQEGVERIDVELLRKERLNKKKRAGKLGFHKKLRLNKELPDKLFSTIELLPMITGPIDENNIQTHSIDLNVVKIDKILGGGVIPVEGKTILAKYEEIQLEDNKWCLQPGAYNVEFAQGCNIPSYAMLLIRQRSSLLRNGGVISSSIWDANFKTDSMGTVMFIHVPITIEFNARIATIYGYACDPVSKLYAGQWMQDVQRGTNIVTK